MLRIALAATIASMCPYPTALAEGGTEKLYALIGNCTDPTNHLGCDSPIFKTVWVKIPSSYFSARLDVRDINVIRTPNGQYLEIYLYAAERGTLFRLSDVYDLLLNCHGHFEPMDGSEPYSIFETSIMRYAEARACRGRKLRN